MTGDKIILHSGSKSEHPEFTELAESLFSLIQYRSSIQRKCARLGEMECRFLNLLSNHSEAIRMNSLAELLDVSESRITRLVERMIKKGMVIKHLCNQDRRSWKVRTTKQGKEANLNVSAVSKEVQSELVASFPEDEREAIYRSVKTYIESFHKILQAKEAELESTQRTELK